MISSYEIRWFFDAQSAAISAWLDDKGMQITECTPFRSDFYLPLPAKNGLGIKLREGNVEIKQLIKTTGKRKFGTGIIVGRIQNWVKWSFNVQENDSLSKSIIQDKAFEWLEVKKYRVGYKYELNKSGRLLRETSLEENLAEGCQVEYTRIVMNDKVYYTFGLESFSNTDRELNNFRKGAKLTFDELIIRSQAEALVNGPEIFSLWENMSYPEFLERMG